DGDRAGGDHADLRCAWLGRISLSAGREHPAEVLRGRERRADLLPRDHPAARRRRDSSERKWQWKRGAALMAAIGQNIPHDSAAGHVSGESIFVDDIPPARNEVFVDVVGSPVAHGEVISVDTTEAAKAPGVVAIFTHRDIPGHKRFGPVAKDEHLLVEDVASFVGDPIVLIAAESRGALAAAKKLVKITMRELPPILSID